MGCIISQNLLVPDVSEDDINAAVAGIAVNSSASAAGEFDTRLTPSHHAYELPGLMLTGCGADGAASNASDTSAASSVAARGAVNVQNFTGDLGGAAPPVEFTAGADRPFAVDGATFLNQAAALQRSCSVQHNACADAANSGQIQGGVAQCDTQEAACNAAAADKRRKRGAVVRTSSRARRAALDTGSCGSPAIEFADGLDGRDQASFEPVNQQDFNHGSALNIAVISDFICQQLSSKCDAPAATVSACEAASAAAQAAADGKSQASADAFNQALGV